MKRRVCCSDTGAGKPLPWNSSWKTHSVLEGRLVSGLQLKTHRKNPTTLMAACQGVHASLLTMWYQGTGDKYLTPR